MMLSLVVTVVELTTVLVPLTVRFPVTVRFPPTVSFPVITASPEKEVDGEVNSTAEVAPRRTLNQFQLLELERQHSYQR